MNIQTCPKCGKKSYKNMGIKIINNNTNAQYVNINFAAASKNPDGQGKHTKNICR
jgi:hypothetical protein